MSDGGFSEARLGRMRDVMNGHVERGAVPGLVTLVSRHDEVHVDAIGKKALGDGDPMRRDTIFRIALMTKPVAAVAAKRPITLRDLLTLRLGIGAVLAPPERYPIQAAMDEAGIAPGPDSPTLAPDEWMRCLGGLPLIHQPGENWMYETGFDVLGVLISRATAQPLETFFRERVFGPLGMEDTGFYVPVARLDRLANCYAADPETGALELYDDAGDSNWSRPPVFESCGGGLVSTVDDYLVFCRMMLNKGKHGGERILSRPSVELITTDHLTSGQRAGASILLGDNGGWGFGVSVISKRDDLAATPGRFGWDGGYGTSGYSDPEEDMVGILMTQRLADSSGSMDVYLDFCTSVYQAIDD